MNNSAEQIKKMIDAILETQNGSGKVTFVICPIVTMSVGDDEQENQTQVTSLVPVSAAKYEPSLTFQSRTPKAKRFTRYNFTRNLISLACSRSPKSNPDGWMHGEDLANAIAQILDVTKRTAKSHISRAVDMNLLEKNRDGNDFYYHQIKAEPIVINFDEETKTSDADMDLPH